MLAITHTTRFAKDLKRIARRGWNIELLKAVISDLAYGRPLDESKHNHPLKGNYQDRWECHIKPDWLLISYIDDTQLVLERTGSHSDLLE